MERTAGIGVGGNHGLVVEVIGAGSKTEKVHAGEALAAIGGASHRHLGSVDALLVAVAEKYHDIAVEKTAARVEGQAGIGTKITGVGALAGGQRQIHAMPDCPAVAR